MASGQPQKLGGDVRIKASATKFHDVLCRTHLIATIIPDKVKSVELLKGEWGKEGSNICWNYVHDGKACVAKESLEVVDRENNKITFTVLEGDLMEYYKSFKFHLHVLPQNKGSLVKWTMEYVKQNDNIPDPHSLVQFDIEMSKEVDAYIATQEQK